MTPDRRSPRLKDVAEAAGVHISTASRALNERTAALLNPATLERVRETADGLGYRVNGMARAGRPPPDAGAAFPLNSGGPLAEFLQGLDGAPRAASIPSPAKLAELPL